MGLIELEAKIRSDGEREVREIAARTEAEVNSILSEIESAAGREADRIIAEGRSTAILSAAKILSDARESALRRASLAKNAVLDGVFEEAKKKVLAMPDSKKSELLLKLSAHSAFSSGGFRVLVDLKYYPLVKSRKKNNFVKSGLGDFGVVIESKDGLVRVDNRLNVLVERMKPALKPKIGRMLFGGVP